MMDLPVAQIAFGKEHKLDIVDLTVEEGEEINRVRERIQARLNGMAQVERPSRRGEQIEFLLTSFRVGLFFVSLIALFVGFFLIFNTVSISVVQRKREIGALRCIGLLRRDVLMLFVIESLAIALIGSLSGVFVGALLAKGAVLLVGRTVSNLFLQVDLAETAMALGDIWVGLGSGLGVSLLAGLYPAMEATRVNPVESSRQAVWTPRSQRISRASLVGILLLLMSLLLLLYSPAGLEGLGRFHLGVAATLLFLLALCFLSPLFILWSVRFLRLCLMRFTWVGGQLGLDNLARNPVRCGITVATLMISLAAIFTISVFIHSVRGSLLTWVDQMVTADLIVSSSSRTAGPINVPLKEELAEGLKTIPGVRIVDLNDTDGDPLELTGGAAEVWLTLEGGAVVHGTIPQHECIDNTAGVCLEDSGSGEFLLAFDFGTNGPAGSGLFDVELDSLDRIHHLTISVPLRAVPEPATLAVMLITLLGARRRRR